MPIGSSSRKYSRTIARLMIATCGADGPSASVKYRPRTSVAPSVRKYDGPTSRSGTSLCSPCHGRPSTRNHVVLPHPLMGRVLVTPTDETPGSPPMRSITGA